MATEVKIDKDKILALVKEAGREGMDVVALQLSSLVREALSQPGQGRIYRIGKGSRKGKTLRARGYHRASAPGQPPAVNTGRLRSSFSVSGRGGEDQISYIDEDNNGIRLTFGSRVSYAGALEHGTNRVAARPYLEPAVETMKERVAGIMAKAIKRRLGKK